MPSPDPRLYRPNVGIMVVNQENHVLIARRLGVSQTEKAWQMPQGGIDDGEDPVHAAYRELAEELGVQSVTLMAEYPEWVYYDLPSQWRPRLWQGHYKGQRQKWFLMRLTGPETDITVHTRHPEFSQWRWASLHEVPSLVIDFKRDAYEKICGAFSKILGIPYP
jgi:putative (di)nucleoside polyphosphate hydrolase